MARDTGRGGGFPCGDFHTSLEWHMVLEVGGCSDFRVPFEWHMALEVGSTVISMCHLSGAWHWRWGGGWGDFRVHLSGAWHWRWGVG